MRVCDVANLKHVHAAADPQARRAEWAMAGPTAVDCQAAVRPGAGQRQRAANPTGSLDDDDRSAAFSQGLLVPVSPCRPKTLSASVGPDSQPWVRKLFTTRDRRPHDPELVLSS
jgi:hypothetical protein